MGMAPFSCRPGPRSRPRSPLQASFLGLVSLGWPRGDPEKSLRRVWVHHRKRVRGVDTIEVLHNHRAERIRLNGIDCPEKGQPYGKKAKQAVSAFVFGKHVTLKTYGLDKYGRTIAEVLLRMERTSTTSSSNKVGVGGIEHMLLGRWSLKSWNEGHEEQREAYRLFSTDPAVGVAESPARIAR